MRTRTALLSLIALAAIGCRGQVSGDPPIHIVPNMDWQAKITAQDRFEFEYWTDKRGMRKPPEHTVARGSLSDDALVTYNQGTEANPNYVTSNPLTRNLDNLQEGQKWFNITCSVCHGKSARGGGRAPATSDQAHGLVGRRWPVVIPSLVDDGPFVRDPSGGIPSPHEASYEDGRLFDVITNGKGTMPAYAHMITPERRWQIIHYIRALQHQARNP